MDSSDRVKVLLVDDRAGALFALEAALSRAQFDLATAANGIEALSRMEKTEFALVILDAQTPGLDARRTAELLQSSPGSKDVPLLFMTAFNADPRPAEPAPGAGVADFLYKPIDIGVLKAKVRVFADLFLQKKEIEKQSLELKDAQDLLEARVRERIADLLKINADLREDICRHKLTEDALRESEHRFRSLADSAPVLIWMSGTVKLRSYFNKRWLDFTHRSLEQEMGNGWIQGVHPDDFERCWDTYIRAFDLRQSFSMEYRLRRYDGEFRWLLDNGVPWFSPDGTFKGFIGSCLDVTGLKQTEEVLRESEKTQKEFVANVSHDFRTPVAAIKGFAETLIRGAIRDSKNRLKFVKTIEKHAVRLGWLVEDLLTLSTIESGKADFCPKTIRLSSFVRDFVRGMAQLAKKQEVAVNVDIDSGVTITADPGKLSKVFQNLLTNAIKFNRPGGSVNVAARFADSEVIVSIEDNGIGIADRDLPHVFERFYRADKSRSREAGDTGLGLHIAKQIIEASNGRIWAESREGRGSVFYFAIPTLRSEVLSKV